MISLSKIIYSKSNSIYFLILLFFSSLGLNSQSLIWAKTMGANATEAGQSIVVDQAGNVYTTGYFQDTVDFDPGTGVYNLISQGGYDIYVQKLDPSGNFLWAQSYGGANQDYGNNIMLGQNGEVLISGTYNNTIDFDFSSSTTTATACCDDLFLLKLSQSGSFKWVRTFGLHSQYATNPLYVDNLGNVYSGAWNTGYDFDPGPSTYTVPVGSTVFKLDSLGNFQWAKGISTPNLGAPLTKVIVDQSGNVIISGNYSSGPTDLDPGPGTQTVNCYGYSDYYIVKLDCNGMFIWGNSYGSPERDGITDMAVAPNGDIYFGSYINAGCATIDLDAGPGVYYYTGCGGYIVKIDQAGVFKWASNVNIPYKINQFNNSIQWLVNYSAGNQYLNTYDSYGNLLQNFFLNNSQISSIASNTSGTMYMTGAFTGTANLAPGTNTFNVSTNGNYDAFVSKISYCEISIASNTVQHCAGNPQNLVVNGVGNFTWLPGPFVGKTFSVNPSGNTTYTVTGVNGTCVLTKTVLVNVNSNVPPVMTVSASNTNFCSGGTVSIVASGANNYSWFPQIYNGQVFTPTSNAVYTVTGTNSTNNCKSTATVPVIVNATPIVTIITSTNTVCSAGSVTLNASGATNYTWSNGAVGALIVINPTVSTNYSVIGTNSAGCLSTNPASVSITALPRPTISINSGSLCAGNAYTLLPSGALTYTFSSGTNVVSPSITTTYSVSGTSSLGCSAASLALASVLVYSLPIVSVSSASLCAGQSFILNPSGANAYTYSGGSATVSPTVTSNYSITGTSAQGCLSSNIAVATVSVYANPNVSVNSGTICNGQSFTIIPNGAATYSYSSGSNIVTPSSSTIISVTGTSSNGCISTTSATSSIIVFTTPIVAVNGASICTGQSLTLSPTGAVTYTFSSGSPVVSPTVNTTYSISGQSSNGCVSASMVAVTVTVSNTPSLSVNSGSVCSGSSFTLNPSGAVTYSYSSGSNIVTPSSTSIFSVVGTSSAGCISSIAATSTISVVALPIISASGGSICPGQSYTISPSGAASYTFSSGSAVVSPTVATTYSVIGTNASGCNALTPALVTIGLYTVPLISVPSGSICQGSSYTLMPSGAVTYSYSSGTSVVSPLSTQTYSVLGTNVFGCVSPVSATANVVVNLTPSLSVNSGSVCSGSSFTLNPSGAVTYSYSSGSNIVTPSSTSIFSVVGTSSAGCISSIAATSTISVVALPIISASGGSICPGQSYTISPSGAASYTFSSGSAVVSPTVATTYSVIGTNASGCNALTPALVTIGLYTVPLISVPSGSICQGSSYTLMPSGAVTYSYSSGTSVVSPLSTQTYSVLGTNVFGCVSPVSATANVVVNLNPSISVNSGTICSGNNFTILPSGASTYSISGGTFVVYPGVTTIYSVIGTSSAGCVSTVIATASVFVNPTPSITVNSGTICAGKSFTINATGANTYSWNGAIGLASIVVSPSVNTNYSVSGNSINGCPSNAVQISSVIVLVSPVISSASGTICKGATFTISPNGAMSYTFSSGSAMVSPSITSTYSILGTNSLGCVSSVPANVTVVVNPLPVVSISGNTTICKGTAVILNGTGAQSYTWNTGQNISTIQVTPSITTTYSITGLGVNGCKNASFITINVGNSKNINGVCTSSTGVVNGKITLYRHVNYLKKWDSISTSQIVFSAFQFNNIDSGKYVLRVVPTNTNMYETYGSNSDSWKSAVIYNHGCVSNSNYSVAVNSLQSINKGSGVLAGKIVEGNSYGQRRFSPGNPIGGITVKGGKNPGGVIVGKAITDSQGNYSITGLPPNSAGESYFVEVDIPGIDTNRTYHRIIMKENEIYANLDFYVDSAYINPIDLTVGIKSSTSSNIELDVFPNPSNGILSVKSSLNSELEFFIFDISGRTVLSDEMIERHHEKDNLYKIDLRRLKPGSYVLRVIANGALKNTLLIIQE